MNQVNLNFNKNLNFKSTQIAPQAQVPMEQTVPDVQIPDMYYNPEGLNQPKGFKETLKSVDMMGLIYPWVEHPILMAASAAGLAYGVDKFSSACSGEYEKSLVGKAAKFGDNIATSNFAKSKPIQTLVNWKNKGVEKFNKITKNSDLINAIRFSPSKPEWKFVKDELLNMESRIVHQFTHLTNTLKLAEEKPIKITNIGLNNAEKESVKKYFKVDKLSKVPEEKVVNYVLLKRLKLDQSKIKNILDMSQGSTRATKDEILKALGLTVEDLKNADLNPEKYVGKIKEAVGKVKGRVWAGAGEYSLLGPIQPFKRTIGCDELFNRFHSLSEGAKTNTGRAMSRFLQKCHRGFTFGGGKLGVLLFISPQIVDTIIDTKNAEPNQKIGTVAHGLVEAVSWVFTFPLAISIMHHLSGAQYAGMSKSAIEEVRKIKEAFNNTVFGSHDEYKAALKKAKKRVKELETVKGQNLLTKISRKIGKFVTLDLERFKSYRNGTFAGNTVRKVPGFFKNVLGVPMRFGIWGCISMGVLGAALTKGTKLLFGNFHDRYKIEEQEAKKKTQKEFLHQDLQNRLLEAQTKKVMAAQNNTGNIDNKQVEKIAFTLPTKDMRNPFEEKSLVEKANEIENMQAKIAQSSNEKVNIVEENIEKVERKEQEEKIEATSKEPEQLQINEKSNSETIVAKEPVSTQKYVAPVAPVVPNTKTIDQEIKEDVATKQVEKKYVPNQDPNMELLQKKQEQKDVKIDNYTYVPSSENILNKKEDIQDSQKYIPSQLGAKFTKSFDNSGLADALRRADRAEQRAIQTLAGNFEGI